MMNKLNLNIPINSLGYGVVGYNLWRELNQMVDVTLWPMFEKIEPPLQVDEITTAQIKLDWSKQENFNKDLPTLKIWHEDRLAERIGTGPFYAFPFFEVNKFNSRRMSHLRSADQIIVASEWAKDIVINQLQLPCGVQIVHVVPCGVDRTIFKEQSVKQPAMGNKCIFFNCGKWEVRKGHDILHKAFKDAFSKNEDVELWMMTENPFLKLPEKQQWEARYSGDHRIKLLGRVQFQTQLADIMRQAFCGVFPSRTEGWNLELLEMMSMGKWVITTDYSAHTQFCNSDNSLLIDIVEEEPMYDGRWFVGDNGTWASLDGKPYDQLVHHLQSMYREWELKPHGLNHHGIATAKELSWNNAAKKICEVIYE
jgi:glycosyltransferase involved in cell wall biosynthesis